MKTLYKGSVLRNWIYLNSVALLISQGNRVLLGGLEHTGIDVFFQKINDLGQTRVCQTLKLDNDVVELKIKT